MWQELSDDACGRVVVNAGEPLGEVLLARDVGQWDQLGAKEKLQRLADWGDGVVLLVHRHIELDARSAFERHVVDVSY